MLIPFKKYLLISNFPKEIVVDKLISITDNKKFIRITNTTKIFEGNVDENSFEINRILNYRNSFYPIISGNFIAQNKESTLIKIKMRMTVFSIIFMSIWFLITGTIFIAVLSEQLQYNKFDLNSIFMSLFFILFGYLLMIIGFNYEVKKAEKIINEVL